MQTMKLTPVQRLAADRIFAGLAIGDVILLRGKPGTGKTTILETVHASIGGVMLGMRQFLAELAAREPLAIEEAFLGMLEEALSATSLVFVDDLHLITNIVQGCDYPRPFLLDAALTALLGDAAGQRKKLVFATGEDAPWPVRRRAVSFEIGALDGRDYEGICRERLPCAEAQRLDYARIHRFAPGLNGYQLKNACAWIGVAACGGYGPGCRTPEVAGPRQQCRRRPSGAGRLGGPERDRRPDSRARSEGRAAA
jgi:hypothetical protein